MSSSCCAWSLSHHAGLGMLYLALGGFSVQLLSPAWCHGAEDVVPHQPIVPVSRWQQFWMSQVLSGGSVGNVWLPGSWELPKQLFPFSFKDSGGILIQIILWTTSHLCSYSPRTLNSQFFYVLSQRKLDQEIKLSKALNFQKGLNLAVNLKLVNYSCDTLTKCLENHSEHWIWGLFIMVFSTVV